MPNRPLADLLATAGATVGAALGRLLALLVRPIAAAIRRIVHRERRATEEEDARPAPRKRVGYRRKRKAKKPPAAESS